MAEQEIPIPQGAQIGEPEPQSQSQEQETQPQNVSNVQDESEEVPIPQGATIGEPPKPQAPPPPKKSVLAQAGDIGTDLAKGFGEGALDTVHGTGELIRKGLNLASDGLGNSLIPEEGQKALEDLATPVNLAQKIGYGGETLAEFVLGDAALKGLSLADKMAQASKILATMQKSPRLVNALKVGAEFLKGDTIAAKAIAEGARQGIVGGAQEGVRSGDLETGVKAGATNAVVGGAVSGTLGTLGKLGSRLKNAYQALAETAEAAKNAPDKSKIVEEVKDAINKRQEWLNKTFETGVERDVKAPLRGETLAVDGSPLQDAARNIQGNPQVNLQGKIKSAVNAPVPGVDPRITELVDTLVNPHDTKMVGMTADDFLKKIGEDEASILAKPGAEQRVGDLMADIQAGKKVPTPKLTLDEAGNVVDSEGKEAALAAIKSKGSVPNWSDYLKDNMAAEMKASGDHATAMKSLSEKYAALKTGAGTGQITAHVTNKMDDFDIDKLITLRQELGKIERSYYYGDPSARMARTLKSGIDDTIESLANGAGKPDVVAKYDAIRKLYKDNIHFIDSTPIDKLRTNEAGKALNEVGSYLLSGKESLDKVKTLEAVIGRGKMDMVADSIFKNWAKDSMLEGGHPNLQGFIKKWESVPEEVRKELFGNLLQSYGGKIQNAINAKNTILLNKLGISAAMSPLAASTAFAHPLVLLMAAVWGVAGRKGLNEMLDKVAANPAILKGLGKFATTSADLGTKVLRPASALGVRSAFEGAKDNLAGKESDRGEE